MKEDVGARIIVALDGMNLEQVYNFAYDTRGLVGTLKVHEFLDRNSSASISFLHHLGFQVWPDFKFFEPPNKIQGRMMPYIERGVAFLTVSMFAGGASLRAAAAVKRDTKILGVGILSHLSEKDVRAMLGFPLIDEPKHSLMKEMTQRFARQAAECGLDGMVCAPADLQYIAELNDLPKNFLRVATNVRPDGLVVRHDDQNRARSATPVSALAMGADYVVIGSPITQAPDPVLAIHEIRDHLAKRRRVTFYFENKDI